MLSKLEGGRSYLLFLCLYSYVITLYKADLTENA